MDTPIIDLDAIARAIHARITGDEKLWAVVDEAERLAYRLAARDGFRVIETRLRSKKWREIESAPKDGRFIFLSSDKTGNMRIGYWSMGRWADLAKAETRGPCDLHFTPTHWQPTPQPPESATLPPAPDHSKSTASTDR